MRRIFVCLVVALVLLCSVVGLKNIAAQATGNTPVVLASGSAPPPPIPDRS